MMHFRLETRRLERIHTKAPSAVGEEEEAPSTEIADNMVTLGLCSSAKEMQF